MKENAFKLHKLVQLYTVLALVLSVFIIIVIACYPLQKLLKEKEATSLRYEQNTSVLLIKNYFERAIEIAKQISSRSQAKNLVLQYQNNKITFEQTRNKLIPILQAALNSNSELEGIVRLNIKDKPLASVGHEIPKRYWPEASLNDQNTQMKSINYKGLQTLLSLSIPIITEKGELIGRDISLFSIKKLNQQLMKNRKLPVGDVAIIQKTHSGLEQIFSIGVPKKFWSDLKRVLESKNAAKGEFSLKNHLVTYTSIKAVPWMVVTVVNKAKMINSIKKVILVAVFAIILITFVYTLGLNICLRPLREQMLVKEHEFKEQISKGKADLKKANSKLKHLVDHDFLTGVTNRRGFHASLKRECARARRYGNFFTLFYVDMDGFKEINDSYGHKVGDEVLINFANGLTQAMREEDTVARLGGDEFAIITPKLAQNDVQTVIDKINTVTQNPIVEVKNKQIYVKISIGSASYPEDADNIDRLFGIADHRMYEDKEKHKKDKTSVL